MMQIIHCKNCGQSNIGFGNTCVNVEYKTHYKTCEHCNNTRTDTKSDFFCSIKCFEEYMRKELDKK